MLARFARQAQTTKRFTAGSRFRGRKTSARLSTVRADRYSFVTFTHSQRRTYPVRESEKQGK